MTVIAWLIYLLAAILEVGGDAVTRTGLRSGRWIFVLLGAAMLGLYGIVVNTVRWDFSRLHRLQRFLPPLPPVIADSRFFSLFRAGIGIHGHRNTARKC